MDVVQYFVAVAGNVRLYGLPVFSVNAVRGATQPRKFLQRILLI
ncbi:hypothetical protein [Marivirga lumbricoides]